MSKPSINNHLTGKDYLVSLLIIGTLFFIFGFITWLNGILIPYLRISCELNNFESYFVTFAFYMSYLVMALPSSHLLKYTGFKKGMAVGLIIMAIGALIFVPAAMGRLYGLFLTGLFIMGTGLAILQTASNPYITILGPLESAAKRISIMGICNKIAGVLSPLILGSIILNDSDNIIFKLKTLDIASKTAMLDELSSRVIVPYIIMACALIGLAAMVRYSPIPDIDADAEDETLLKKNGEKTGVLQFPHLVLGVIALFFYVGVEVIAGDTIISYGQSQGIALSEAKVFTSYTLISMVIGYILGIATIPKYIKQESALALSAAMGVIFSLLAITVSGFTSVMCIALLGLANSMMWPCIWPLAIKGLGRFTKTGSSLLIMAIAGGALLPLLYGKLADLFAPQYAYFILIPCYLFILHYSIIGHKKR